MRKHIYEQQKEVKDPLMKYYECNYMVQNISQF